MSDWQPPDLTDAYLVDSIEFREQMVVVNFSTAEDLKGRIQDHTNRVILAGADEDVDGKVREIMESVQELVTLSHVAKRNPPATRPARQP